MIKAMVFGTFDGLHVGHLDFFKQARQYGDYLTVVVAHDKTVKKTKGLLPRLDQEARMAAIKNVSGIDEVVAAEFHDDPYRVIAETRPDVICLGYDQKHFIQGLKKWLITQGLNVKIHRLKAFHPEKYKSSIINENFNGDT